MSNSSDLPGEQPKSIWTRPIKVKFGKLAESLGKGAIAGAFGNWAGVAGSGVDALKALGLGGQEVEAIAWMLVQRSLLQAMSDLAAPYQKDLTQEPDFAQLCEQLDTALEEGSLTLSPEFFDRPKDLEILGAVNMPYRRWLQTCGLPKTEAEAIAGRLPTHFVFALNEQWRSHPQEYAVLKDRLDTPFTKATERERAWMRYGAWLQRRVDEPMFAEAFSLRQIYVPLRAYFLRAEKGEAAEARRLAEGREREKERVVVELERQLLDWLDHAKVGDTVRVICGGPGSGKSSFSKMLAAKLVAEEPTQRPLSVLFIPLHQLRDLSNDLSSTIDEFIQSDLDGMLPPNPLEKENAAKRLLLVFDGLDELAMQGKIAAQVAQDFIKEVKGSLLRFNRNEVRVLALMSGREVVVQASQNEFRQEGQVLHVLPYIQLEAELEKHRYIDEHRLLNRDQRQDWWRRYGKLKGQSYEGMPDELAQDSLAEITAQPLLNYLVALSHDRGELVFSEETNLNAVYADLLKRVYSRDWESYPHPELGKISETNFVRLLEETAVACWHGNGRTTTVKQIEDRCSSKALKRILDIFEEEGTQLGVTRLLTAFYFRQSGVQGSEATFEFTHKSFGEYLTARRVVREMMLIHQQFSQHQDNSDLGWDERECLKRWATLCGKTALDEYLLSFLRDEVQLYSKDEVRRWQQTFTALVSDVLQHGMPMEKFDVRPSFLEETRQARNTGETLLAALDGCARVTEETCRLDWKKRPEAFGEWLMTLRGQRTSYDKNGVVLSCLRYLTLSGCLLIGGDFYKTDLSSANLSRANLSRADLRSADLSSADLSSAILSSANLSSAILSHVDLSSAILSSANLISADLSHVDLSSANLSYADLSYANLSIAILLSTDLRHCEGLTSEQLTGNDGPLLCNIALPFRITDIDPNRDCDRLPQALSDRYGIPLEEAQKIVDEARQNQWD